MLEYEKERKIKILIVEDDDSYRFAVRSFLEENSSFMVIGEAEDGQTAIDLAQKENPDIVMMDIGLPNVNGIIATKRIKENRASTKVIILTGHSDEGEAERALAAGATAYASKDIPLEYLPMIISTVNRGAVWLDPFIGNKVLGKSISSQNM